MSSNCLKNERRLSSLGFVTFYQKELQNKPPANTCKFFQTGISELHNFKAIIGKIALSLGGCPLQVLFCPQLVLGLSQVCLFMSWFGFFCPSNVLVLPLFCPGLALERSQNPFDVLAMTFFQQKIFRKTLEGLQKGYL